MRVRSKEELRAAYEKETESLATEFLEYVRDCKNDETLLKVAKTLGKKDVSADAFEWWAIQKIASLRVAFDDLGLLLQEAVEALKK